jgi:hypothetical protein
MKKLIISFMILLCACNTPQTKPAIIGNGPVEIKRTTTVGSWYTTAAAIKGTVTANFKKDDISMGVLGYAKNTGSHEAGVGHIIGTFGLAEDNTDNLHYLIGVEGRVNGVSVDHPGVMQIGSLGLSTFIGTHFDKSLFSRYSVGVTGHSEIYNPGGKTPLYEGVAVNFFAPSPIGGAVKYSVVADEQAWFRSANSVRLGLNGVNTGSLSFASSASGTIKLKPQAGALGSSVLTMPALTGTLIVAGTPPATAKSAGKDGEIAFDTKYFYWYAGSKWNRIAKDATF